MLGRLSLLATGTRSTLIERLKEAQQNEQALSQANVVPSPVENGGDHVELKQQFEHLEQQQVQDLLDRNPSDERLLSESELTQVKSLVQAAVNAFAGSSSQSQAAASEVSPSSANAVPSAVQESLNSLAVHGMSEAIASINSSTSQRTLDSIHGLPAKLVKDVSSGEFMELSKLLPKKFMTNLSLSLWRTLLLG